MDVGRGMLYVLEDRGLGLFAGRNVPLGDFFSAAARAGPEALPGAGSSRQGGV